MSQILAWGAVIFTGLVLAGWLGWHFFIWFNERRSAKRDLDGDSLWDGD